MQQGQPAQQQPAQDEPQGTDYAGMFGGGGGGQQTQQDDDQPVPAGQMFGGR
jgi:hypothetical protein